MKKVFKLFLYFCHFAFFPVSNVVIFPFLICAPFPRETLLIVSSKTLGDLLSRSFFSLLARFFSSHVTCSLLLHGRRGVGSHVISTSLFFRQVDSLSVEVVERAPLQLVFFTMLLSSVSHFCLLLLLLLLQPPAYYLINNWPPFVA